MCEFCKEKKYRFKERPEVNAIGEPVTVQQRSHCISCGKEYIDYFSLRHIATRIEVDGKLKDVHI